MHAPALVGPHQREVLTTAAMDPHEGRRGGGEMQRHVGEAEQHRQHRQVRHEGLDPLLDEDPAAALE